MALTALGMVLTPGPNMMYLVSRSISQGREAGFLSLAGTFAGFLTYMTLANFGLAVVFVAVPWLYIGFKAADPAGLWAAIQEQFRADPELAGAAIVVCQGEHGWDDYLLLHHFDPSESLDEVE